MSLFNGVSWLLGFGTAQQRYERKNNKKWWLDQTRRAKEKLEPIFKQQMELAKIKIRSFSFEYFMEKFSPDFIYVDNDKLVPVFKFYLSDFLTKNRVISELTYEIESKWKCKKKWYITEWEPGEEGISDTEIAELLFSWETKNNNVEEDYLEKNLELLEKEKRILEFEKEIRELRNKNNIDFFEEGKGNNIFSNKIEDKFVVSETEIADIMATLRASVISGNGTNTPIIPYSEKQR
ncbi:hypothetical protein [Spiroplasma endosymbiont of Cantharis rufa]|uniref:hypothetical protein n=1 Tax=Spiroplasma endosymbiont of Cantharis rufa TaxID=3066279 RepID=UPI0030D02305